jgi:DNA end-binding protein Ku
MGRAIWSGMLSFGLVSIPVRLYPATEARKPTFHEFQKDTGHRVRYVRVNEQTGREVQYSDVVKGADIGGGNYLLLEQEELDSIAPGRSRLLDIHLFVNPEDIDPIYFNKAYFLGPGHDSAKMTYALLRDAMARSGKAAIARFVMRGKEYLAAVLAGGDALVLETLFFADEIRDPHQEIGNLPGRVELSPRDLQMAGQLIDAMSGPWNPSDYRDAYAERVNDLIEAKRNKKEFRAADEPAAETNVTGLTETLQASLDAAKKSAAKKTASASKRRGA